MSWASAASQYGSCLTQALLAHGAAPPQAMVHLPFRLLHELQHSSLHTRTCLPRVRQLWLAAGLPAAQEGGHSPQAVLQPGARGRAGHEGGRAAALGPQRAQAETRGRAPHQPHLQAHCVPRAARPRAWPCCCRAATETCQPASMRIAAAGGDAGHSTHGHIFAGLTAGCQLPATACWPTSCLHVVWRQQSPPKFPCH